MRREVWMIDPVHLTPYYDAALCQALVDVAWSVRQFTSPFLYDSAFPVARTWAIDYLYGRGLNWRFWLSYPRLRRSLRVIMYLSGHRQLLQQIEKQPPDVVHIQWSRLPKIDRILIERIRQYGIPVVHTVHDVEPLFAHAPRQDLFEVYRIADRLIVHTYVNRDALLTGDSGLDADRIQVVSHIAVDFPIPVGANREIARRKLGIPADAQVVLFFGTARAYKGLDLLVEAFKRAQRFRPDLWLLVAGLQERGVSIGGDRVVVHGQYVPSDRVWTYHLAADVAVFPYRRVSQSGALITAMGFGLPVIVSDVGGLPETVRGNGWVVPCDSPEELGDVLIEAVRDVERLRFMGKRSQRLVRDGHAPEMIAAQTAALYEELIRSRSVSYSALTV